MKLENKNLAICLVVMLFNVTHINAQDSKKDVNLDESKVQPYELPDVLTFENGKKVTSSKKWEKKRRPEILQLFKEHVYGHMPDIPEPKVNYEVVEEGKAYEGTAIRKQVAMTFIKESKKLTVNLLMYLPVDIENPPVFFGYNFYGNQSITADPNVLLSTSWTNNNKDFNIGENKATEGSRNKRGYRWDIELMLENGFGLAAVYYGDVDPDRKDNFEDGIHPFFYKSDQEKPLKNEWGAIGAWAWGASRTLDYLKQDEHTKGSKFIMFGHSRLGKASLWAGAQDTRFDMVISNNSGCGGAAISRRKFGETVKIINESFPHWFNGNFKKYNDAEETLPLDQHMLIALIAPRPVYVTSAEEDLWADPKGEYLSAFHAGAIYDLFKMPILPQAIPPKVNVPIHDSIIGYHRRTGKHDVTTYDWEQFMKFAKKWLVD